MLAPKSIQICAKASANWVATWASEQVDLAGYPGKTRGRNRAKRPASCMPTRHDTAYLNTSNSVPTKRKAKAQGVGGLLVYLPLETAAPAVGIQVSE